MIQRAWQGIGPNLYFYVWILSIFGCLSYCDSCNWLILIWVSSTLSVFPGFDTKRSILHTNILLRRRASLRVLDKCLNIAAIFDRQTEDRQTLCRFCCLRIRFPLNSPTPKLWTLYKLRKCHLKREMRLWKRRSLSLVLKFTCSY